MNSKEIILSSLITDELKEINKNIDFWGKAINLPKGTSWTSSDGLNLSSFLEQYPEPSDPSQIPLFGIAWELNWGHESPEVIVKAREKLLTKNRFSLGQINELEEIWLKLIAADAELF